MKKEDIEFLRELQHELNTQETDGQASPRYWGIVEKREFACAEGDGVVDFANTYLRKPYQHDFVGWIDERHELSGVTGCFLTKRAAKQYLDNNYYHHEDGHTYAMTAWRNPEFERLLNILQTMNIDDIKED